MADDARSTELERAEREHASGNGAVPRSQRPNLIAGLGRMLSQQVQRRIPQADLDERDPDYIGVERRFYQLAHNLVLSMPGLGFLRKYGTVAASPQNAELALDQGAALLVYPGGDYEVHRPSWETAKVDFGRRKGWIRLALDKDVPIVPVVSLGGQETALFLSRGEWLSKLLRLDRMFRLKVLPISLALPWGLNVGDMMSHIPLPAKI